MNHRISVGALVVKDNKILMVNHQRQGRYDFWVAPGGGIKGTEHMQDAVIREVKEETGFDVSVGNLLYIEEMYEPTLRIVKFWFQCELCGGELDFTSPDAISEYIVNAKFMTHQELRDNIVFPSVLKDTFWQKLARKDSSPEHITLRAMEFY